MIVFNVSDNILLSERAGVLPENNIGGGLSRGKNISFPTPKDIKDDRGKSIPFPIAKKQ